MINKYILSFGLACLKLSEAKVSYSTAVIDISPIANISTIKTKTKRILLPSGVFSGKAIYFMKNKLKIEVRGTIWVVTRSPLNLSFL